MLKVEIQKREDKVEAGQVRYNNTGMYVLIVHSREEEETFDAIVLTSQSENVSNFGRNSLRQFSHTISAVYPYLAEATLTID